MSDRVSNCEFGILDSWQPVFGPLAVFCLLQFALCVFLDGTWVSHFVRWINLMLNTLLNHPEHADRRIGGEDSRRFHREYLGNLHPIAQWRRAAAAAAALAQ